MIVGTAGHIDHGKSALVCALTGQRMDRLAEEQKRGITIELNFAALQLDGMDPVGIVDVPGHEDFVRTMVAGASGVDLVLLVVDAQEGIRPQTLEHLAIAEQLGVPAGIPVLTKCDLPDPGWLELVRQDLAERLAHSPIRFEPVAVVSALTGEGIAALRERLERRAAAHRGAALAPADLLRLPVDRAFSLAGAGTVITGTVWSGEVRPGDQVRLEPGGLAGRVRTVESFGRSREAAGPGSRAAVSLAGPARADVARGQVLVGQGTPWQITQIVDAVVRLLPDAAGSLVTRTRLRLHHGTAEVLGRAYPRGAVAPGEQGLARLVLEAPVVVRGGDRFVLRSYSPVRTIGGGWIADPVPPRRATWPEQLASDDPAQRLAALAARRPAGVAVADLPVLTGLPPARIEGLILSAPDLVAVGDRITLGSWLAQAETTLLERVRSAHAENPSVPGVSQEAVRGAPGARAWLAGPALDALVARGELTRSGGLISLPGFTPRSSGGEGEVAAVVEAIRSAGLEPPTVRELAARLDLADLDGAIRVAVGRGMLEPLERDRYVSRDALERFGEAVRMVGRDDVEISPAALRDRLGLSRKFLIPLLEWSDRSGLTRRGPDGRRTLRD